jgi:hypothetical protein
MTNEESNAMMQAYGGTAQAYCTTVESSGAYGEAKEAEAANQDEGALAMFGLTLAFVMITLTVWMTARAIVGKKAREEEEKAQISDEQMKGFESFRKTWNDVAKNCVRVGEECEELEKCMSCEKREVASVKSEGRSTGANEEAVEGKGKSKGKERVVKASACGINPCIPDNQEWGEW